MITSMLFLKLLGATDNELDKIISKMSEEDAKKMVKRMYLS